MKSIDKEDYTQIFAFYEQVKNLIKDKGIFNTDRETYKLSNDNHTILIILYPNNTIAVVIRKTPPNTQREDIIPASGTIYIQRTDDAIASSIDSSGITRTLTDCESLATLAKLDNLLTMIEFPQVTCPTMQSTFRTISLNEIPFGEIVLDIFNSLDVHFGSPSFVPIIDLF